MRSSHTILAAGLFIALWLVAGFASGQQVTIGSPFNNMSSGFFEHNGFGFSGNWNGANFTVNNGNLARPTIGGFDPAAGMNGGFAVTGRHGQVNVTYNLAQGYRQNFSTQTPMVTLMNGQNAYFSDTSQTPFVVSVVPVVGGPATMGFFPALPSPAQLSEASGIPLSQGNPRIQELLKKARAEAGGAADDEPPAEVVRTQPPAAPRPAKRAAPNARAAVEADPPAAGLAERLPAAQASSAGRAAPSVAEARRMREVEQAAQDEELLLLFERGQTAEEGGKPNVAKLFYQQVARRASGELKQKALARLDAIRGTAPTQ